MSAADTSRSDAVGTVVSQLDAARMDRHMTKAALAGAAGMVPSAVRRVFSARRTNPTVRTVAELAAAIGLELALVPATAQSTHGYAAVYRRVLFPFLDGTADRYFNEADVTDTAADREALAQLRRAGAVIAWGEELSLSQPHKALLIFAVGELARPDRVRWSPPEKCQKLIDSGRLMAGSAVAVLQHFDLSVNPISDPPETIWHGTGPAKFSTNARDGWIPLVADELTGTVPLAVAYADLFCVSDWRADAFADYILRRVQPAED